jgi:hypothetical protein
MYQKMLGTVKNLEQKKSGNQNKSAESNKVSLN